jgi:hypothetical protein
MGRWAQRRMRAGGGASSTPPAPLNVVLVQVTSSDTAVFQFDGDPLVNSGIADGNVLVNGTGFQTVTDLGGGAIQLQQPFGQPPISSGDPWDITAQPAWATAAIVNPQNGITF